MVARPSDTSAPDYPAFSLPADRLPASFLSLDSATHPGRCFTLFCVLEVVNKTCDQAPPSHISFSWFGGRDTAASHPTTAVDIDLTRSTDLSTPSPAPIPPPPAMTRPAQPTPTTASTVTATRLSSQPQHRTCILPIPCKSPALTQMSPTQMSPHRLGQPSSHS